MKIKISDKMSFKKLFIFALPSIVMMLFMASYQIVDAMFVANFVGTDALSALNITYPITSLFVAIGVMFGTGGSALVGKKLGEGEKDEAKRIFSLITTFAFVFSLILSIVLLIFVEPLLYLIGADADTFAYSKDYMIIILIFAPFGVLQMLYQSFLVVISKPHIGLAFTISSGLANIIFDYVFIVLCDFGIAGAALGTIIGYLITAIGGSIVFIINKKGLRFSKFKFKGKYILKSMSNGASEMVINLAASIITLVFNLEMARIAGSNGIASITAILYFQYLMQALFIGYSNGIAPVFSYNYGEREVEFIREIRDKSLIFICIGSIIVTITSLLLTVPLCDMFSKGEKEIYDLIYKGNIIFSINYLFAAFNIFLSSFFTAINDGKTSAVIAFCRTFLFILIFSPILSRVIGADGVFMTVPIAEFLTFIVCMFLLPISYKKDMKKINIKTEKNNCCNEFYS